jgi:hypothetical protein
MAREVLFMFSFCSFLSHPAQTKGTKGDEVIVLCHHPFSHIVDVHTSPAMFFETVSSDGRSGTSLDVIKTRNRPMG